MCSTCASSSGGRGGAQRAAFNSARSIPDPSSCTQVLLLPRIVYCPFHSSRRKKNLVWNWAYQCAGASVLSEAAHAVLGGQNIQLDCNVLAFCTEEEEELRTWVFLHVLYIHSIPVCPGVVTCSTTTTNNLTPLFSQHNNQVSKYHTQHARTPCPQHTPLACRQREQHATLRSDD